jgi:molybdenum cofactor cytidylyltransferase
VSDGVVRAVILAAGTSSRAGRQKLLMEFRGRALIEHPIAAAQPWSPIVVAGREVAEFLCGRRDVAIVRNDEPELGMSRSLQQANRVLPSEVAMIVLLGDKPLVSRPLIETVCRAARSGDVVYPVRSDEPVHPVFLSPRARRYIDDLPAGDTLRFLRMHPDLTHHAIETAVEGAFFDVDTLDAFDRIEGEPA